jgi:hypothetical protein
VHIPPPGTLLVAQDLPQFRTQAVTATGSIHLSIGGTGVQ